MESHWKSLSQNIMKHEICDDNSMAISLYSETLGADKVSMWTYTYPHKPQRKRIKWPPAITRLTAQVTCGIIWSCDLQA